MQERNEAPDFALIRRRISDAMSTRADEILAESVASGYNRGSSRGPMVVDPAARHPFGTMKVKIFRTDGRTEFTFIEARISTGGNRHPAGEVYLTEEKAWSDNDDFWQPRLEMYDPAVHLIIDHQWYKVGKEERDREGRLKPGGGFAGRLFRYRMLDTGGVQRPGPSGPGGKLLPGPIKESRNLWFGGVIPPSWRDRLPDNAVFVGFDDPVFDA